MRALLAVLLGLLLLALAWRFSPLSALLAPSAITAAAQRVRALPLAPLWAFTALVCGSLLLLPWSLLCVQMGMVFAPAVATSVCLAAIFVSTSVGFAVGRGVSTDRALRFGVGRWPAVERLLRAHAVLSIATLRLLPTAPFTMINVIGGASPCSYRTFIAGTLIGMIPSTVLFTLFGRSLFAILSA